MKTHTGARKAKGQKKTIGESLKGRLASIPSASVAHLDDLLSHKSDNPVVNMVRWFFFYADESGHGRVHGKTLAH